MFDFSKVTPNDIDFLKTNGFGIEILDFPGGKTIRMYNKEGTVINVYEWGGIRVGTIDDTTIDVSDFLLISKFFKKWLK